MRMTIDEAIEELDCPLLGEYEYHNQRIAKDIAIETMRKYQKIVQIMERTIDDGTSMYDTLQEIEEVVEDGNND